LIGGHSSTEREAFFESKEEEEGTKERKTKEMEEREKDELKDSRYERSSVGQREREGRVLWPRDRAL